MPEEINHIGIIIDGNRRYAKKNNLKNEDAYVLGAKKVYDSIVYIFDKTNIEELSIYALSYDNLLRDPKELTGVLSVQKEEFLKWSKDPFFTSKGIKIKFIGYTDVIPKDMQDVFTKLEKKTESNDKRRLNILFGYMGDLEVSHAVQRTALNRSENIHTDSIKAIKEAINENLQVKTPLDLIIRTANEHRLSGFLPLQSQYAEIYVLKKLWPEINTSDIKRVLNHFKEKEMKHGL